MAKQTKGKGSGKGLKKEAAKDTSRLGNLLAQLRQKHGYSMQKLALATGVSAAYICRIESGERRPSRELLQTLADVLIPETSQAEKDELLIAAGFAPVNFRNFMGRQDVLAIYQKALAENPHDFKTYIALVLSLIRSGQHEQAREHINQGMQQFDDMVQLQSLLAALELSKQNFKQAIRFQQEAIRSYQMEPDRKHMNLRHTDLLLSLGVMNFEYGNGLAYARMRYLAEGKAAEAEEQARLARESLNEAAAVFKEALAIDANDVYILDELARVHFTLAYIQPEAEAATHWQACIEAFEQAVCSPDKQDLGYHALLQSTAFLALAYSKSGKFEQAWFTTSIVEACLPNFWLIHYIKACYFGLRIIRQHQGQRTEASAPLFASCLRALEKAASISDAENRTREEAAIDPDLEPVRAHYGEDFEALLRELAAE